MIEGILPECYFTNNLRGLSVDMAVFRDLLKLRSECLCGCYEPLHLFFTLLGYTYVLIFTAEWVQNCWDPGTSQKSQILTLFQAPQTIQAP